MPRQMEGQKDRRTDRSYFKGPFWLTLGSNNWGSQIIFGQSNAKVKAFNDNRQGISWFYGFLQHHLDIKMKKAEKLEHAHAMACTKEPVYALFDEFEQYFEQNTK